MNNQFAYFEDREEQGSPSFIIDFGVLARAYFRKLKYVVLITLITVILTALWLVFGISRSWKADCYVIRAPKNVTFPIDMPYLYQSFDINTILETVRTRDVMLGVIQTLNLDVTPEQLLGHIEVQRGNRSNVLKFTAKWSNAEDAAVIANTAAESFITNNVKLLNSATAKIHDYYLSQQKARLQTILELEDQYAQHRAQHGVVSIPLETQIRFEQLRDLEFRMIENQVRIKDLESKIEEMDEKLAQVPKEVIHTWTYTQTDEKKLLILERELESLKARFTDENPKVKKVQTEINELRKTISNSERDIPEHVTWGPSGLSEAYTIDRTRLEAEKKGAIKMNQDYQVQVAGIKASLSNLSDLQKSFLELERQLDLNREILRIVEGRLAESSMAMHSNVSDYEILEYAHAPMYPDGLRRKLVIAIVGFMTFFLSSLIIVLFEATNPKTRSPKDFQDLIKIPLIGLLPDENKFDELVFYRSFQVLVDNILRYTRDKKPRVITFGSDMPETGKSFIVKECASMISNLGKKVLYIDTIPYADENTENYLVNPMLYNTGNVFEVNANDPQLHNAYFLADSKSFTSVLDTEKIKNLLASLNDYDFIFWETMDCEYSLQVFSSIACASDILVLVAGFNQSNRNKLARLIKFLGDRDLSTIYGVLNRVSKDFYMEAF